MTQLFPSGIEITVGTFDAVARRLTFTFKVGTYIENGAGDVRAWRDLR
jgi:hypothetical protein